MLFADIVGSTELIVGLDAEAARDRLEPTVRAMVRAVRRFDGTVLRTLGDGLKAAFGVPLAQEGHALLACRAALAMQEAVAALPNPTSIRVGLHSGEVIAGTLDTGSAVEQEAQGMTVHLASRIEQTAEAGAIYISRDTWSLVESYCDGTSIGVRSLRGIPEPVEIYRLTGLRPMVNSDHFRCGDLTRLHGRDAELGLLQQALHDAGQVDQRRPRHRNRGTRRGRQKSPLLRVRRMVPPAAGAGAGGTGAYPRSGHASAADGGNAAGCPPHRAHNGPCGGTPDELPSNCGNSILPLADGLPLLADFLNVADPDVPLPSLDPRTRQARLREIIARMVKAAGRRPRVIIVEDLHWLDDASQESMDHLVEASAWHQNPPGGYLPRAVVRHPGPPRTGYRELRLAELAAGDMHHIVRDLVGDAPALDQVVARVADQSGGNPFFAHELVLSLAQSGVLVGGRGSISLGPSGWNNPVLPATVEAVVGARIDRLGDPQKVVLQIGAVVGKEFPFEVVRAVAGVAEQRCNRCWISFVPRS